MRLRALLRSLVVGVFLASGLPAPALAAFHLMEIEQVIGGVNGDTSAQAVQLKMRSAGQNLLANPVGGASQAKVVVRDAAGANPITIATFTLPNPISGACRPILLATDGFAATTTPPVDATARDYAMSAIPDSYLAAGSLTFENLAGSLIYWRLSWGGVSYTGTGVVATIVGGGNDVDGTMNPPFAGPLPSSGLEAVRYTPACPAAPTDNLAQYALSVGAATFTNNDLTNFAVTGPVEPVPVLPGSAGLALVAGLGALAVGASVLRRRLA